MSEQLKQSIGAAVRAARQTAELTQEELADRVGRHADTISLIERGRTLPTLDLFVDLAKALEVPISDMLPDQLNNEISRKRSKLEAEILQLLRQTPEPRLAFVRDVLNLMISLK